MHLPAIGHAIAKRWVKWTDSESIPTVPVGIIEQRVRPKPQIFTNHTGNVGGTGRQEILERSIGSRRNKRPLRQNRALRKGRITPQSIKFRCEIARHPVLVLFRRSVLFSNGQEPITVYIKTVSIGVLRGIASVEWVEIRAKITLTNLIESTCSRTHPNFKTVRHSVAIGVRASRIEVHSFTVFIEFSRETSRKARIVAIVWVRPTILFRVIQSITICVFVRIRG